MIKKYILADKINIGFKAKAALKYLLHTHILTALLITQLPNIGIECACAKTHCTFRAMFL